jgi:hypothetical protein
MGKSMDDKVDAIIKGKAKPKFSYYISPHWIKIALIIFLLLVALEAFGLV